MHSFLEPRTTSTQIRVPKNDGVEGSSGQFCNLSGSIFLFEQYRSSASTSNLFIYLFIYLLFFVYLLVYFAFPGSTWSEARDQ